MGCIVVGSLILIILFILFILLFYFLFWLLFTCLVYDWLIKYYFVMIILGVIVILLAIVIKFQTKRGILPNMVKTLSVMCFLMSMIWIWFCAELLVSMLKTFGLIFNIPSAFLGMTFLAFGNSLPELAVNCSLAKNGYSQMAISGSVGGPLFNLVFGFGFTLIKTNIVT